MKKLLGLAVAGALVIAAAPARAEILKNLKTSGELEVMGTLDQNVATLNATGTDSRRNTQTRLTYGLSFDLLEDARANIAFVKNDRYYGTGAQTANGVLTTVNIQEANVVLDKLFGKVDAKIGRQFYGDEGDINIFYGVKHGQEGMSVNALDAARFDYSSGKNSLTVLWSKVTDANSPNFNTQDNDTAVFGVSDMYKLDQALTLGAYAYNRRIGKTAANQDSDSLWIIGAKAKGEIAGLGYYGEAVANRGSTPNGTVTADYTGYAFLAKANYNLKLAGVGGLNPRAMFAYGSGDRDGLATNNEKIKNFVAVNPDFRPGLIFSNSLPTGSIINTAAGSLANMNVINVGVDFMPEIASKFSVALDGYSFARNATAQADSDLATEIDLGLKYKQSENITLGLAVGRLWAGNYLKDAYPGTVFSPATMAMTTLSVKF